jgi:hypothetical protein
MAVVLLAALGAPPSAPALARTDDSVDFGRDVRPILANRCYKCHGPDAAARQADLRLDRPGPATAPGRPGESELIARVTAADEDVRMPPHEVGARLTADEIDVLARWIAAGAEYRPHWSFVPPARSEPPPVTGTSWPRGPLDRFVLARLEREGLAPSPEADRATLIRRVSLDLTGLPPTPEEVDAFVRDERPDAYERVVDRLLASPHYGERWARTWLDLARYADTKGYEKDGRRTIWPYRDWVVDAFNRDLPFDRFTIEQLAGDLLAEPTDAQLLATAFHRNTMTNDEGGTDDEEFRHAAVVDRVNTTAEVWMGLTVSCAQCHAHKFDPIGHDEYYRLFAFFNDTADADAIDDRPLLAVLTDEQKAERERLRRKLESLAAREAEALRDLAYAEPDVAEAEPPAAAPEGPVDHVWIEDDLPPGARPVAGPGPGPWEWVTADGHPVFSGERASRRRGRRDGVDQHFFTEAYHPLEVAEGDVLFAYVYLDPADPPRSVMMQLHDGMAWEHRAYWGENLIPWGVDTTPSRLRHGDLPPAGEWVRLEVEATRVGLAPGAIVAGWAFSQHGGTIYWDRAGVRTTAPPDDRYLRSRTAWEERVRAREAEAARLPADVRAIVALDADARTAGQEERLGRFYLAEVHAASRARLAPIRAERERVAGAERNIMNAAPKVPITRALPPAERRTTHVHQRGSFLDPGDEVRAAVPAVFAPLPDDAPATRLGLARWLVSGAHPLTARVVANRYWEQLFGTGLVETVEDFGTQGAWPSHPALLDWLATELVARGWSLKALCRTIVTSATYRQASARSAALRARDPENRLLAAGPSFRLEAEMIRDQALAVSGLLDRTLGGPPVFPPQPEGVWQMVYSADRWMTAEDAGRHRRALYTFWRRTSPYPSMITFDAPSREFCVPRRLRTNTPLQALVTLNDPVYVEAAQALARRIVAEGGPDPRARAARGLRLCLGRRPSETEIATLVALHASELAHYRAHPAEAERLAADPLGPVPDGADVAELAAWTVVGNVLLNLDEFLTKG